MLMDLKDHTTWVTGFRNLRTLRAAPSITLPHLTTAKIKVPNVWTLSEAIKSFPKLHHMWLASGRILCLEARWLLAK